MSMSTLKSVMVTMCTAVLLPAACDSATVSRYSTWPFSRELAGEETRKGKEEKKNKKKEEERRVKEWLNYDDVSMTESFNHDDDYEGNEADEDKEGLWFFFSSSFSFAVRKKLSGQPGAEEHADAAKGQ